MASGTLGLTSASRILLFNIQQKHFLPVSGYVDLRVLAFGHRTSEKGKASHPKLIKNTLYIILEGRWALVGIPIFCSALTLDIVSQLTS